MKPFRLSFSALTDHAIRTLDTPQPRSSRRSVRAFRPRSASRSHSVDPACQEFRPASDTEMRVDPLDVFVNCVPAEFQVRGNLLFGLPGKHFLQDPVKARR